MPELQFDIVFRGTREGFDVASVKVKFATLFKLEPAKVTKIFKSTGVTLKHKADERLANIFIARLFAIGVVATKCLLEPTISKAILTQDCGNEFIDSSAMHQPIEFLYGEYTRRIPFVFSGNGFEYCRLWLVNILVCLLSAGILYPWAYVRSLRYLYQHTELNGVQFQCTANPQKIYILQFLLVFYMASLCYAFLQGIIFFGAGLVFLVVILPFYWFKCGNFKWQYSFYKKVGFYQSTTLLNAYVVYFWWPLLAILTFGFAAPYTAFKIQQYQVCSHAVGPYVFSFSVKIKNYFVLLPSLLIIEGITAIGFYYHNSISDGILAMLLVGLWGLVFMHWRVVLANIKWNATYTALGYFVATWDFSSYSRLILRNIILCLLTLGLYWPWAKIICVRYKSEHLAFLANQRFVKWQRNIIDTEV